MKRHSALIAAAALLISTGLAAAQSQMPRNERSGAPATTGQNRDGAPGGNTGVTGAPSSTNPQAGGGAGGLTTTPHGVPENGGAANSQAPNPRR
jgi:hypothetical protein